MEIIDKINLYRSDQNKISDCERLFFLQSAQIVKTKYSEKLKEKVCVKVLISISKWSGSDSNIFIQFGLYGSEIFKYWKNPFFSWFFAVLIVRHHLHKCLLYKNVWNLFIGDILKTYYYKQNSYIFGNEISGRNESCLFSLCFTLIE